MWPHPVALAADGLEDFDTVLCTDAGVALAYTGSIFEGQLLRGSIHVDLVGVARGATRREFSLKTVPVPGSATTGGTAPPPNSPTQDKCIRKPHL